MKQKINEQTYYDIKAIRASGMNREAVKRITGLSEKTVTRVTSTKDYTEYKSKYQPEIARRSVNEQKKVKEDKGLTYYQQQMLGMMREQNKALEEIKNDIHRIVDELI